MELCCKHLWYIDFVHIIISVQIQFAPFYSNQINFQSNVNHSKEICSLQKNYWTKYDSVLFGRPHTEVQTTSNFLSLCVICFNISMLRKHSIIIYLWPFYYRLIFRKKLLSNHSYENCDKAWIGNKKLIKPFAITKFIV